MVKHLIRRSIVGAPVSLLLITMLLFLSGQSLTAVNAASGFSFKTFELSSTPGVNCPNAANTCTNGAAEPQIRADKAGHFYASSENGLGGGTEAWNSTNGGKNFLALVSPNAGSSTNNTGFAPGGGDTDVAVAPVKNTSGQYNVYIASLSLANVDVSTSTDGGKTWALNLTSATIPGDDREWIAADGASKVCISYHDAATFNINVNCSSDAGSTFTQLGEAFDTNHLWLAQNNSTGNLVIDPTNHYVYQTFSGIANSGEVMCSQQGTCGYHVVWVAVSTDGGKTFTDHMVYDNPTTTVSYGHQFVNLSIDREGNLYSVYSDNHNTFYSFSTSHATTWSAPVQVNGAGAATAIMPWSVANNAGHLDIVFYGT
ncbi:MAG TPA: sialidase family protein, partial [Ktedonobacteraceae bacterium]|nr:sialidase family protein [Ktedonobacteraceae bacterium]